MEELGKQFGSPAWWVTSVFLAILINVISVPIQKTAASLMGKVSTSWRRRNAEASARFEDAVHALFESADKYHALQNKVLLTYARATFVIVTAVGILLTMQVAAHLEPVTDQDVSKTLSYFTLFSLCLTGVGVFMALSTGTKESMLRAVDRLHAKLEKHEAKEAKKDDQA